MAAPDRGTADPAGQQAADAGGLPPRAVVVPRDDPTAVRLGGPGPWVRHPAQAAFGAKPLQSLSHRARGPNFAHSAPKLVGSKIGTGSYWIPGSWILKMVSTDDIPCPEPRFSTGHFYKSFCDEH